MVEFLKIMGLGLLALGVITTLGFFIFFLPYYFIDAIIILRVQLSLIFIIIVYCLGLMVSDVLNERS